LRAKATFTVAHFSWTLGDYALSRAEAQAAMELAEAAGDEGKPYLARLVMGSSSTLRATGDLEGAFQMCARSIQMLRQFGDDDGLVPALILQGVNATGLERYTLAQEMLTEGEALARKLGDTHRVALARKIRGDLAYCEGKYERARQAYEQSLAQHLDLGQATDTAGAKSSLGHAYLKLGALARARELFLESTETQRSAGNRRGLAECLLGFGVLAQVQGQPEKAVRLLAAAVSQEGMGMLYATPAQRRAYEHHLAAAEAALSAPRFAKAKQAGQAMTLDQAIDLALEATAPPAAWQEVRGGLTPRQLEVVDLIAQGKTNGEIAEELVLSKRTVEKHVANILAQLEVGNRAEIVRWGLEQGLG
jgi:DNA-binding CsgD family transcriptional regulator